MKKILAITMIAGSLSACGHGGSVGIDAEKSTSESTKSDSSISREKGLTATGSNGKKESMPALMLLGDAAATYVEPMFPRGAGVILPMMGGRILRADSQGEPCALQCAGFTKDGVSPQVTAIALASAVLAPQLGWPMAPASKAGHGYMLGVTTAAIFANNLYAKAATKLNDAALLNQGDAKEKAIDLILAMKTEDLETVFAESLEQGRAIVKTAKIDGQQKLGNIGWAGNGATVYGDQSGWHLMRSGNNFFGGDAINGKSVSLSMDNTLDHTMSKRRVSTDSSDTSTGSSTKASAGLK